MPRPALAFVDLETTGASIARDRITEIGIVEVDEDGVRQWSTLVNPEQPIPPFIADLTGITDDMVADAPRFDQVADDVAARLKGRLFVAHNARFDYGFLKHEYRRLGRRFAADTLCTVKLSKALFPEHYRHNLDSLVERHGLQVAARHRALGDAELLWQFLQRVEADLGADPVWQTIATLSPPPVLPSQIDPELPDLLPDGPGVYLFRGEGDALLFVAKAKELRKRVLAHLAEDALGGRQAALLQALQRVEWIETPTDLGAQLLEARLIKAHTPRFNPMLGESREWCAYTLVPQASGALRPELVYAVNGGFDGDRPLYGLFHSAKDARQALRKLADAFRLCLIHTGLEAASKRPFAPCFAFGQRKCDGACVGKEPLTFHNARLLAALGKLKLADWPWGGPIGLKEVDAIGSLSVVHVIDHWRYKGAARDDAELAELLAAPLPPFDGDLYRLLKKALGDSRPDALIRFPTVAA